MTDLQTETPPWDEISAKDSVEPIKSPVVSTAADESTQEPSRFLGWSDQRVIMGLLLLVFALGAVHWIRLTLVGTPPVEIDQAVSRAYEYTVDLNAVSWVELAVLDGIGPTLSRRIIEDRKQRGPFASVDDLARVNGIGPLTLEKLRPWLKVETPTDVISD